MLDTIDIQALNRQSKEAWEKLYVLFYPALCSYVYKVVECEEIAKDIVQETLIKIWSARKQFTNQSMLTLYLYRAVYNNALYYKRSNRIFANALDIHIVQENIPQEEFSELLYEECCRQLILLIDQLPMEQRRVILLTLEGKSGSEIAELLDISITTVKTHKYRSFKFIRSKLNYPLTYLFFHIITSHFE